MTTTENTGTCRAPTKAGGVCRVKPMESGFCMAHDATRADARARERSKGGSLTQARRKLTQARADALARVGADPGELLPSLESVGAMSAFLAGIVKKTATREFSPQQASAMIAGLRLAKDLLSLGVEIKLLEEMEKIDNRKTIGGH